MSLYTCKAHNMSGPTPCCQFASRVTGVEHVSTTSASTSPPTATARETEARRAVMQAIVDAFNRVGVKATLDHDGSTALDAYAASIRATEREAAVRMLTAERRDQIVPGDLIPFVWNAALQRAIDSLAPDDRERDCQPARFSEGA